jgi:hypothetical protein
MLAVRQALASLGRTSQHSAGNDCSFAPSLYGLQYSAAHALGVGGFLAIAECE